MLTGPIGWWSGRGPSHPRPERGDLGAGRRCVAREPLRVKVANAPGPDSCVVPSRSEVEVVIDQMLSIVPVGKVSTLARWGVKIAKAAAKKLVEFLGW